MPSDSGDRHGQGFIAPDGGGYGDIYTIATDGTHLRRITRNIGALDNSHDTISWR